MDGYRQNKPGTCFPTSRYRNRNVRRRIGRVQGRCSWKNAGVSVGGVAVGYDGYELHAWAGVFRWAIRRDSEWRSISTHNAGVDGWITRHHHRAVAGQWHDFTRAAK